MLKLFILVSLLPVSQWLADAMGGIAPAGARWLWTWLTHCVLCLMLLMLFDQGEWPQMASGAAALTWMVRNCYFLKRLGSPNQ